mgnify:FL=1
MARTKATNKTKEPVKIRFKECKDGSKSIYLDIYKEGVRKYEFLKLYIIPETTPFDKAQNKETMKAAVAIKAQRIEEIISGKAGIKATSKLLLVDWLDEFESRKKTNGKRYGQVIEDARRLVEAFEPNAKLGSIDKAFVVRFIRFIKNEYKTARNKPLKENTMFNYCNAINIALNEAKRDGMISSNPFDELQPGEKPKHVDAERAYLTIDEVKALIATDCDKVAAATKAAFLFSCFTGFRYSDVADLKWGDIVSENGHLKAAKRIVKTGRMEYIDLNQKAVEWLPERGEKQDTERVFELNTKSTINNQLVRWGKAAGIQKHFSFHSARHTCATMLLTMGGDLYAVSKILGHADISTTQIYAKIVDEKKRQTIDLLDGAF